MTHPLREVHATSRTVSRRTGDQTTSSSAEYVTFWGFEVTQPTHTSPYSLYAIETYGYETRFLNLVVHDAEKSGMIVYYPPGGTTVVSGCIMYNNGDNDNLDHGIYVQNRSGKAHISGNVFFNNRAYGVHAYTELWSGPQFDETLSGVEYS
jgi:hypothetical protein